MCWESEVLSGGMFATWDGPDIAAFWVAIGAASVALTSLIWQLYYATRVDRPRLRVRAQQSTIHSDDVEHVVVLTVTNVGRRATVVHNLLLMPQRRPWLRGRVARILRRKELLAPRADEFLPQYNARFPKRLEPGDEASIYMPLHEVLKMTENPGKARQTVHALGTATTARNRQSRNLKLEKPTSTK